MRQDREKARAAGGSRARRICRAPPIVHAAIDRSAEHSRRTHKQSQVSALVHGVSEQCESVERGRLRCAAPAAAPPRGHERISPDRCWSRQEQGDLLWCTPALLLATHSSLLLAFVCHFDPPLAPESPPALRSAPPPLSRSDPSSASPPRTAAAGHRCSLPRSTTLFKQQHGERN